MPGLVLNTVICIRKWGIIDLTVGLIIFSLVVTFILLGYVDPVLCADEKSPMPGITFSQAYDALPI
jgi:hypothetical protein